MNQFSRTISELHTLGSQLHQDYANAKPYPHIVIDDFFNAELLDELLSEFPDLDKIKATSFENAYEKKLASQGEYIFGEKMRGFMHVLNSEPFLEFLERLTGIKNLIPDPHFIGGGCHQIKPGGYLKVHADFNKHIKFDLDRRLNVLVYLNKDWDESYGGHFELWDDKMTKAEAKILPLFNRLVVFSTTDFSFHGHPEPLTCPPDRSRKSLALYYYTNGRPEYEVIQGQEVHSTLFRARPGTQDVEGDHLKRFNRGKIIYTLKRWTPPVIWDALKKTKGS
jgi:Rps23 Pro-64 3,4-dihydroxylase Tpa1-like proline 4-hydroxylase